MNINDNLEILTIQDLMDILYIGKNTAYELLNSGEIKAFRIGNTWKIPKAAIDDYIIMKCASHTNDVSKKNSNDISKKKSKKYSLKIG